MARLQRNGRGVRDVLDYPLPGPRTAFTSASKNVKVDTADCVATKRST
jgi:hypothetical protein